jgi:hypothetical protein
MTPSEGPELIPVEAVREAGPDGLIRHSWTNSPGTTPRAPTTNRKACARPLGRFA